MIKFRFYRANGTVVGDQDHPIDTPMAAIQAICDRNDFTAVMVSVTR